MSEPVKRICVPYNSELNREEWLDSFWFRAASSSEVHKEEAHRRAIQCRHEMEQQTGKPHYIHHFPGTNIVLLRLMVFLLMVFHRGNRRVIFQLSLAYPR